MKKILDFIMIFLLVFLLVNFFNNTEKKQIQKQDIEVSTTKSSYAIPASVKLNVVNNTNSWILYI